MDTAWSMLKDVGLNRFYCIFWLTL